LTSYLQRVGLPSTKFMQSNKHDILRKTIRDEIKKHFSQETLIPEIIDENWYANTIEEPVRNLVKFLRNEGFNTESSCGHDMYVQCQYIPDGEIFRLHKSLIYYLHSHKLPENYEINLTINVSNGKSYPFLKILLPKNYSDSV